MKAALTIEQLVQPVSDDLPSGEDLRYTEVYDKIKEARRADEPLDQGEWRTCVKTADWREVVQLSCSALMQQSKDLQIAVWLTEAWINLHGFAGLAAGLELVHRLLQDFWLTLHPMVEDGDLEYRIGPLSFLNEKLPMTVYRVPLCDPAHSKGYDYYQWESSRLVGLGRDLDKEQKKRREALIQEGNLSAEEFNSAVNSSSTAYYNVIDRQLTRCREFILKLDHIVNEKFAPDPPGLSNLIKAIEACANLTGRILKGKNRSEVVPQDMDLQSEKAVDTPDVQFEMNQPASPGIVTMDLSCTQQKSISDISMVENGLWLQVCEKLDKGFLKAAMDQLLSSSALAPSIREKKRYLLLLAKLCLKADRVDLATPIAEELYQTIETMQLEKWEHPSWVGDVVETLYRCLAGMNQGQTERARTLFQKLCLLNVAKAAAYRLSS
jgi:type VI secretion system protein ImpA